MKKINFFVLVVLMIFSLCACAVQNNTTESAPETEGVESDLTDLIFPVTLKEQAKLVVGEDSFDVNTAIELKAGHNTDELDYSVVSDETVASVDGNGILTRKGYGQVSVKISLKSNSVQFVIFNVTFAPETLYGTTYKGGFKKADGSAGNEITLVLNEDKTFALKVGAGQAKYLDVDYELDAKAVGDFTGTYEIDLSSATPVLMKSESYSSEPIKAAFGKTVDGEFCIRVRLNTVTVDGSLKNVVLDLAAQ